MEAARRMAAAQERRRNQDAAVMLGLPTVRTLVDLLDQRHGDLAPTWSKKYAKSRELLKKFWLGKLGDVKLTALNAAVIERIAREAQGKRSDRWRQDVLRYLVDSFIYAERKLKWIEARHNLSAVEMPKPKGKSVAYTEDEARVLLPALVEVHAVAGWMGQVACQTGRRIGAILAVTEADVLIDRRWTYVVFRGETDKARNTGTAAIYGLAPRSDWSPVAYETANDWLRAAETAAEVPHIPGRGWHAWKRLYATLTTDLPGADRQSGTLRSTLEGHYRQDVMGPKKDVAKLLARRLAPP